MGTFTTTDETVSVTAHEVINMIVICTGNLSGQGGSADCCGRIYQEGGEGAWFSDSVNRAAGFERGFGMLDVGSTKLKNMYLINPRVISDTDVLEIVESFGRIKIRDVMDTEDGLRDSDREMFDRKILKAIRQGELYDAIKESLLSMQYMCHDAENVSEKNRRT